MGLALNNDAGPVVFRRTISNYEEKSYLCELKFENKLS